MRTESGPAAWRGTLLADRYLVGEALGQGGMGAVFRATDLHTGGAVAVKFLDRDLVRDPVHRQRLRREAEVTAALTSPRIVRVFDVGERDGVPYLVMEFVEGETLGERLRREGPLAVDEVLRIALEVARALEDAHAHGVVHRDLKPQNVMLADGLVKVVDFGIARAERLPGLTAPGAFVGTPAYAAPEAATGRGDHRADVYSLGVILEAMLGESPGAGPGGPGSGPAPAGPDALRREARAIARRCLERDPARRFQSATDLVRALAAATPDRAGEGERGRDDEDAGVWDAGATATYAGPPAARPLQIPQAPQAPQAPQTPGAQLTPGAPGAGATPAVAPLPAAALPVSLTSFVGRERERAAGREALESSRLVTLIGPGGSGKTRLALQLAADTAERFPDGVRLVELAALSEPDLVPHAVAAVLGVRQAAESVVESVARTLRSRRVLLILDNCEHLAAACAALVAALLRACPALRILATSREPLGITGETVSIVPPLPVPELPEGPEGPDALGGRPAPPLLENPAVRLFVDRAKAAAPRLALSGDDLAAVARICRRLDGIPLALELAAARVRVLSVQQLADRLDDRFRLLTGGSRTAPARQQTLRATLDWSHALLAEPERVLFRRLAVFAGGFELEAAEAVCAGGGIEEADVLDVLTRLVDRSLVTADVDDQVGAEGVSRFRLLESVREYAAERLDAADESGHRARHAGWCLELAEAGVREWTGPEQGRWLNRLEAEHDNLRQAPAQGLEGGAAGDAAAATLGLGLGGSLWRFWYARGYFAEGRRWLEALLALPVAAPPAVRAEALNGAGALAHSQGDDAAAAVLLGQSLAARRDLDDPRGVSSSLNNLGVVARAQGDHAAARTRFEEALAINRAEGFRAWEALTLNNLGNVAFDLGEDAAAHDLFQQALTLQRALGDARGTAMSLNDLAAVSLRRGDAALACGFSAEALALQRRISDRAGIAVSLAGLGAVAHARGRADLAARLFGAADALRRALGATLAPAERARHDATLAAVRADLGPEAFAAAWAAGRSATPDAVAGLAAAAAA